MFLPSGKYIGHRVPITLSRWIHFVFNFIGPENGKGYRVYHDGVLVDTRTAKYKLRHRPMDRRIVIGKTHADFSGEYSSIVIDQLLFFNQALNKTEIAILSQTNF